MKSKTIKSITCRSPDEAWLSRGTFPCALSFQHRSSKMDPEMDTNEMRVLLQGVVKIFEAGLKSKTWDIHRMPQFITMTHREGCETCDAYALHIVKASEASTVEIPSKEVEKAFQIAWPNTVHHIEDEASSESDKKVKWYSDCHDNLTDNVML